MQTLVVEGGRKLFGEIKIAPAKNACLPIIASSIATSGSILLKEAPQISDVIVMSEIIDDLGGSFSLDEEGLHLWTDGINCFIGNELTFGKVRASFFTAGALLSRFRKAYIPYPGGCNIGNRPIDIHIDGFKELGVKVEYGNNGVYLDGKNMHCGNIKLRYPSVGATVNIVCAALCVDGETTIEGVACEPEIIDLCNFLIKCGYEVKYYGRRITVVGRKDIVKVDIEYKPINDRIEAGTFMLACVACGGEVNFAFDCVNGIKSVMDVINDIGGRTYFNNGYVTVISDKCIHATNVVADYFPAFPTDLQPQLSAVLSIASGRSTITDRVFPHRYCYEKMLKKFGAKTNVSNGKITIDGVEKLNAAEVEVGDLRGGAALCIAALTASGRSIINGAGIISRGYEKLCEKINSLGGHIKEINRAIGR